MRSFAFHRPTTVPEMSAFLGGGGDSMPLAGGMTLLPTIKQRLAAPAALVDLSKIPQMSGISVQGDTLTIGAMTRHVEVAESELVRSKIPLLACLAAGIGDPAVRNRGTIGGSVANNDPSADYPAAVLALDATVVTDRREIAADAFFKGLFSTALQDGEIVTGVRFPKVQAANYHKFRNPASRYAIVGVFVARSAGGVRVAVTGAGACVFRVPEMEATLARSFTADAIKDIQIKEDELNSDIHASAEYRAHLVTAMARRAGAAGA